MSSTISTMDEAPGTVEKEPEKKKGCCSCCCGGSAKEKEKKAAKKKVEHGCCCCDCCCCWEVPGRWSSGVCGCFDDFGMCCCVCISGPLMCIHVGYLNAQTQAACGGNCCGGCMLAAVPGCGFCIAMDKIQHQIAAKKRFEPDTCCNAWMKSWCCGPCFLCQAMREVKAGLEPRRGTCMEMKGSVEDDDDEEDDGFTLEDLEKCTIKLPVDQADLDVMLKDAEAAFGELYKMDKLYKEGMEACAEPVHKDYHKVRKVFMASVLAMVPVDENGECPIQNLKDFVPEVNTSKIALGMVDIKMKHFDPKLMNPGSEVIIEAQKKLAEKIQQAIREHVPTLASRTAKLAMDCASRGPSLPGHLKEKFASNPVLLAVALPNSVHDLKAVAKLPKFMKIAISNFRKILDGMKQGYSDGIDAVEAKMLDIKTKIAEKAAAEKEAAEKEAAEKAAAEKEAAEKEAAEKEAAEKEAAEAAAEAAAAEAAAAEAAAAEVAAEAVAMGADILAANGLTPDKIAAVKKVMVDSYGYSHLKDITSEEEAKEIAGEAGLKGNFQKGFLAAYNTTKIEDPSVDVKVDVKADMEENVPKI